MTDTLKNAARIGKEFIYDLGSKYVSPAARALIYSSGLNDTSSLAGDAAKMAVRAQVEGINAARDWINSTVPQKPRSPQPTGSHVVIAETPGAGSDTVAGSGIPKEGNRALSDLVGPTRYEDANGNEIAPQLGTSLMSRNGAFTGPNNDPTTPGMTRTYASEPALTAFNPDDARYAKRQADIAARESQAQIDLRRAIADREDRESRAKIGNTAEDRKIAAEDRQRRIEQEDRMEAFKADQQRLMIENQRAEMERRAVWSQQHGGIPWSPQAEAEQIKKDENRSIADTHEMSVRELNAQEQMLDSDLDIIAQGGAPMNPELIAAITQMTGKPFGSVPLGKLEVERIRAALKATIQRERDMADDRMRSLLGQIRITRTEKQSEFDQ